MLNQPNPSYWQATDECRNAARTVARELLTKLYRERARTLPGERPAFVVVSNAIVTASDINHLSNHITTCPHCSSIHNAHSTDTPQSQVPESLFVQVNILIPMSMLPAKHHASASDDVKQQRALAAKAKRKAGKVGKVTKTLDLDAITRALIVD